MKDAQKNDPFGYHVLKAATLINRGTLLSPKTFAWCDDFGNYMGPDAKNQDQLCRDIEYLHPKLQATVKLVDNHKYIYTVAKKQ